MPSILDRVLITFFPEIVQLRGDVDHLIAQMRDVMAKQEDINAKFDQITAAIAGVRADIEALKGAVTPGEPMSQENFDKLSAIADALSALDAENPGAGTGGTGTGDQV